MIPSDGGGSGRGVPAVQQQEYLLGGTSRRRAVRAADDHPPLALQMSDHSAVPALYRHLPKTDLFLTGGAGLRPDHLQGRRTRVRVLQQTQCLLSAPVYAASCLRGCFSLSLSHPLCPVFPFFSSFTQQLSAGWFLLISLVLI